MYNIIKMCIVNTHKIKKDEVRHMDFKGQSAIVTGAGRGIGRAIAVQLAQKGASVAICDVNAETVKEVENEIKAMGGEVLAFAFDITNDDEVTKMIDETNKAFGKIDILINNVGVYNNPSPFVDSNPEEWKKKMNINIYGTMFPTKLVLAGMIERGYGRIINLGSVAAVYGIATMADYSMTKGAILGFTKALAKEVTGKGITVNAVSPGNIMVVPNGNLPNHSFIGRSGTPDELANVVVFLASKEASYVSGQNYVVDGCRKMM